VELFLSSLPATERRWGKSATVRQVYVVDHGNDMQMGGAAGVEATEINR
jgi:hypothetical protein